MQCFFVGTRGKAKLIFCLGAVKMVVALQIVNGKLSQYSRLTGLGGAVCAGKALWLAGI